LFRRLTSVTEKFGAFAFHQHRKSDLVDVIHCEIPKFASEQFTDGVIVVVPVTCGLATTYSFG
jgi:hypothetical protein